MHAEVLEAELLPEMVPIPSEYKEGLSQSRRRMQLGIGVGAVFALFVFGLLVSTTVQTYNEVRAEDETPWWATPLNERADMDLPMDTLRAQLPVNGSYEVLPYTEHFVEVDLPASEDDLGTPGDDLMHVALWHSRVRRLRLRLRRRRPRVARCPRAKVKRRLRL